MNTFNYKPEIDPISPDIERYISRNRYWPRNTDGNGQIRGRNNRCVIDLPVKRTWYQKAKVYYEGR